MTFCFFFLYLGFWVCQFGFFYGSMGAIIYQSRCSCFLGVWRIKLLLLSFPLSYLLLRLHFFFVFAPFYFLLSFVTDLLFCRLSNAPALHFLLCSSLLLCLMFPVNPSFAFVSTISFAASDGPIHFLILQV